LRTWQGTGQGRRRPCAVTEAARRHPHPQQQRWRREGHRHRSRPRSLNWA